LDYNVRLNGTNFYESGGKLDYIVFHWDTPGKDAEKEYVIIP